MKVKNTTLVFSQNRYTEILPDKTVKAVRRWRSGFKKREKADETQIRLACRNALHLADRQKAKSVALPAFGFEEGGFPLTGSAKIMAQEVLRHVREHKTGLRRVVFCVPGEKPFALFKKTVCGYVAHIQNKFSQGPFVVADAIIELQRGIVIIERSNPPYGFALPGGFIDYGESLEEAVCREAMEETGLQLKGLRQFHTYSDPGRDPRFHTIGTVFIAKGRGKPRSGDDAKSLRVVKYKDLLKMDYAFDHKKIIRHYLEAKRKGLLKQRF